MSRTQLIESFGLTRRIHQNVWWSVMAAAGFLVRTRNYFWCRLEQRESIESESVWKVVDYKIMRHTGSCRPLWHIGVRVESANSQQIVRQCRASWRCSSLRNSGENWANFIRTLYNVVHTVNCVHQKLSNRSDQQCWSNWTASSFLARKCLKLSKIVHDDGADYSVDGTRTAVWVRPISECALFSLSISLSTSLVHFRQCSPEFIESTNCSAK